MIFKYWLSLLGLILLFVLLFFAVGCNGEASKEKSQTQNSLISKGGVDKSVDNSLQVHLSGKDTMNQALVLEIIQKKNEIEQQKMKAQYTQELWKLSIISVSILIVVALFIKSPLQWFKKD